MKRQRRSKVEPMPIVVPREQWADLGLYVVRDAHGRDVVTHARGDQHAAAILDGSYPVVAALADRRATRQMFEGVWRCRPTAADMLRGGR